MQETAHRTRDVDPVDEDGWPLLAGKIKGRSCENYEFDLVETQPSGAEESKPSPVERKRREFTNGST
jgi:hypothetical protein